MKDQIGKNWYMLLIKGIIMVVLALFILINPAGTIKTVALYIGIGFLITGLLLFIRHTPTTTTEKGKWNMNNAEAIAEMIIGVLLIVAPMMMVSLIPIIVGLWAVYYGGLVIIDSFRTTNGAAMLVAGVIIVLLALILVFKPLLLGFTVLIWLGILLLVNGIFNIYISVKLKKANGVTGVS
jgi:uncharacterized membrane protein HdeD (DUF308 family)